MKKELIAVLFASTIVACGMWAIQAQFKGLVAPTMEESRRL